MPRERVVVRKSFEFITCLLDDDSIPPDMKKILRRKMDIINSKKVAVKGNSGSRKQKARRKDVEDDNENSDNDDDNDEEGGNIFYSDESVHFDADEIEKMSAEVLPYIKQLLSQIEEDSDDLFALSNLESVLAMLISMMKCLDSEADIPDPLMLILTFLNGLLSNGRLGSEKISDYITQLCAMCCETSGRSISTDFVVKTVLHAISRTLDKRRRIMKKDVKRVWALEGLVRRMSTHSPSAFEQMTPKFLMVAVSNDYLQCKEGQLFIALLLELDEKLTKRIQQAIKRFLPTATKAQATAFGKIYHTAWLNADENQKTVIEKQCIQELMKNVFILMRSPPSCMEMCTLGRNLLSTLSYLHRNRKLIHLSRMVTDLYTPLIWSYLRSGNNVVRCNAAEVFLDVYPLEKPNAVRAEQAELFERQQTEMMDLLTDRCHIVRIIAVKGISRCLSDLWESFSEEVIEAIVRHIVKEMVWDGSSWEVRKAVFQGLARMLKGPRSAPYLAKILPALRDHIHDENEKVRKAFVEMLLRVKEAPRGTISINYWDIVPLEHLAARLELERKEVGRSLCQLMMDGFYKPGLEMKVVLKRIYRLIVRNHKAARKLFIFSKGVLPLESAEQIMLNIVMVIRHRLKEIDNDENRDPRDGQSEDAPGGTSIWRERARNRKKSRLSANRQNASLSSNGAEEKDEMGEEGGEQNDAEEEVEENGNGEAHPQPHHLDNPEVCCIFLEIVGILWAVNSSKLSEPSNQERLDNLQCLVVQCIPLFLRHFKGTVAFLSVVQLASFLPLAKLNPYSTAFGTCMSRLKSLAETHLAESSSSSSYDTEMETVVLVDAICAWNRGPDLVELATDWIDQAFRSQGINRSALIRSSSRRTRRVKFQQGDAKPMLALRLLDSMMASEVNRNKLLAKSYNALHELYTFMERIKMLIERRLSNGCQFSELELSDTFLVCCFQRYTALMLFLNKKPPSTSAADEQNDSTRLSTSSLMLDNRERFLDSPAALVQLTDWALRTVLPHTPDSCDNVDGRGDAGDVSQSQTPLAVHLLKTVVEAMCQALAADITDSSDLVGPNPLLSKFADFLNLLLNRGCRAWFLEDSLLATVELAEHQEARTNPETKSSGILLEVTIPSTLDQIVSSFSTLSVNSKQEFATYITNQRCSCSFLANVLSVLARIFGPWSPQLRSIFSSVTSTVLRIISSRIQHVVDEEELPVSVNDLPPAVSFLISTVLSREAIGKCWFRHYTEYIPSLKEDDRLLVSAVYLICALSYTHKTDLKERLAEPTQTAAETLAQLKSQRSNEEADSSFAAKGDAADALGLHNDYYKFADHMLEDIQKRIASQQ